MKLIIIGTGETAYLAYEYFTHDSTYEVVAFAVDKAYYKESSFKGLPVVTVEELSTKYPPKKFDAFVALASGHLNHDRAKMYEKIKSKGYKMASYVSSHTFVWHDAKIGDNCFILEHCTIQPNVEIGNNVVLWSGTHVGHSSKIKDNCFLARAVVCGFCEIGKNSFLGTNCTIADSVKIAPDNFIAMGSVINKNTVDDSIYQGNPAVVSKISAKRFCKV